MSKARQKLIENGFDEEIILLEEDIFVDSLVGTSSDDRAVYDFWEMVMELVEKTGITIEEAMEDIDYNIIRSLPCLGDKAPIVVDQLLN